MFLPRSVLTDHSDCSALICCETPPSSARSDSPSSSSRRCSSLSSVSTNSDGPNFDQDVNDSSGDPAYASDLLPPAAEPRAPAGAPVDCILNDATYDKEKDEFLVGFVTIWINRHEFSHIVADSDYYSLESFYQDMIFPFLQTAGGHVEGLPTHPNFALMPPDFYRFLFTNLYCNSPLLDYLAALNLGDCKTVYLLSAGVTMGLRSRLLGTHLILFAQCMVYFSAYNVFLYNGSMFHGRDELFHSALRRLHLHLAADSGGSLDLDDLTEAEVGPYRLSASSVLDYYRKCEELPLTMYLHVIEYNKRACQMYRRANFICVTRIEGFYSINGSQYTANMFAYYMCPPCEL
ncbi:histone acetyltransferase MCC1 [Babesia caballi]|uniref:histone acetyltransferase n=1 Tax=Babesia caballi TaxID=5871 RepID=A0AAV4LV74_BABCB|nr:histone acetyltransferase MCC1 [Babesia caballi]